jgi:hypothetical protein
MTTTTPGRTLKNISWYCDDKAITKGEPGIYHSYMASLATALEYIGADVDPAYLMGASAFAFRIWIHELMCPSAMSVFKWSVILPEAIEQAGFHCVYIDRMWEDGDKEQERREQAHAEIIKRIDSGIPAIAWDVAKVEWGLIIGYDNEKQSYSTLTYEGKSSSLPYTRLGKNGIDVLSVAIPAEPNERSRENVIINSLEVAVAHAEQKEWSDRPVYQNGLAAYDLWASIFDKWAILVGAGKCDKLPSGLIPAAVYYAGHYYSARCYARDYLNVISNGNELLKKAACSFEKVASFLKPVWKCLANEEKPDVETLNCSAQNVRSAKSAEEDGIKSIKEYLAQIKQ